MLSIISLLQMCVYILMFFMIGMVCLYIFLVNKRNSTNISSENMKDKFDIASAENNNQNNNNNDDGPIKNL